MGKSRIDLAPLVALPCGASSYLGYATVKRMKYRHNEGPARRWPLLAGAVLAIAIAIAGVGAWLWLAPHDPVPGDVKHAVAFPVYYPQQSKLPAGYTLDTKSFTASDQAVIYAINYGSGQKITVSVQKRPSDNNLANFYKHSIPIHSDVLTMIGKAAVGAVGEQTMVSLPTNDRSWLIITGPATIDRDQLTQVLQSIVKAS